MRMTLLLLALALGTPAAAQTGATPAGNSQAQVNAPTAQIDCDRQLANAGSLDGPRLMQGSAVCLAAGRSVEGNFLLNAAVLRISVDAMQTIPASQADAELLLRSASGLIFFTEGPGEAEILRDPSSRARLFGLLETWSPRYGSDYTPGWNVRARPDPAVYAAAIEAAKADRRQNLAAIADLVADDAYYALYRRVQEIQAREVLQEADRELIGDLHRQMGERARALGSPLAAGFSDRAQAIPEPGFPPAAPAADEVVVSSSDDPVVARCVHSAEFDSVQRGGRVLRVLITRSPEWGTIWRADISGRGLPIQRRTCTATTTSSQPLLDPGGGPLPPLPER